MPNENNNRNLNERWKTVEAAPSFQMENKHHSVKVWLGQTKHLHSCSCSFFVFAGCKKLAFVVF